MNESLLICRLPAGGASVETRVRPARLRKLRLARTNAGFNRGMIF